MEVSSDEKIIYKSSGKEEIDFKVAFEKEKKNLGKIIFK